MQAFLFCVNVDAKLKQKATDINYIKGNVTSSQNVAI